MNDYSEYAEMMDAVAPKDRPNPDGFTAEWDFTIWNVGYVYRWSDVCECWLDCEVSVTVKPNVTLDRAFEGCMDHPMWLDYAIFFPCSD